MIHLQGAHQQWHKIERGINLLIFETCSELPGVLPGAHIGAHELVHREYNNLHAAISSSVGIEGKRGKSRQGLACTSGLSKLMNISETEVFRRLSPPGRE